MLLIYFVYLDTTSSTSLNLYKGLKLLEVTATGEAPPTSIFIVFWRSPTSF